MTGDVTLGFLRRFKVVQKLFANFTSVGNGADTTADVLATYTLPANFLLKNQFLRIKAWGTTGATGNNKQIVLAYGASSIASGTITDNAGVWAAELTVGKVAANSQSVYATMTHNGTSITPTYTAGTDTDSSPVIIKVTGASGTTGAANDVVIKGFTIEVI